MKGRFGLKARFALSTEIGVEKKRTLNAIEQIKPVLNID